MLLSYIGGMKNTFILLLIGLGMAAPVSAVPKQVILIRHADKLDQEETGPALSAQGVMRSIKFAYYFLDKFGEPDFIISADAKKSSGKEIAIRSLQTVAPLANMLASKYPMQGYPILHPYASEDYEDLARFVLEDSQFNGKSVLICWSHKRINKLAYELGVEQEIESWPKYDYDTVYIIHYHTGGTIKSFEILRNQFPVNLKGSWAELRDKLFRA